jgi:hypothetical protein
MLFKVICYIVAFNHLLLLLLCYCITNKIHTRSNWVASRPRWTDLGRQRCQWQLCTCTCTCWAALVANCRWPGCSAQTDHCTHGNQASQTGFGTAQSIVNKMIGLGWRVPRCSRWMNSSQLNEYFVSNTSSYVLYMRHFLSLFTTTVSNEQDIQGKVYS